MAGLKVITAVTADPVSLAEARLHIRADSDTSEDALVSAWITAAREIAEHYTGRALAQVTLELALDCFPAYEDDVIDLPMPPVASITHVKYTDETGTEQTITSTAYALSAYGDARRIAPTYGNYWPSTQSIPDAVRIRYIAGYAATGQGAGYTVAPKAVKAALQLMVAWMSEHRGDEMDADDIQPPAAKSLLNTIRLWGRG